MDGCGVVLKENLYMEMGKSIVFGNETLSIRGYNVSKDEDKILELWQAAFNNEMHYSLWRWKYIENPYNTAILICENTKGVPVVLYGGIPYKSICCGKEVIMIHLSDIMSHPDYRGSGLFIHTANAYFNCFGNRDATVVMYGFPGRYHFDIGTKYLKYSHLGIGASFFNADVKTLKIQRQLLPGTIARCSSQDKGFDKIWKRVSKSYPLSIVRDSAYVEWRYFKHPEQQYEVWKYRSRFSINWQAFIVLRIEGKKAVIVDILVPDSEKIFRDFLGCIGKMLDKRGVEHIETWVPGDHFISTFFSSCRFKKRKEPTGIIPTIRLFDDTVDMDWACANFYYTMGDGDLF